MQEQIELERHALEAGRDRYYKLLAIKGHGETTVGRRIMAVHVDPMTAAITGWLDQTLNVNKRGRKAQHALLMKDVDPTAMAMLTLRVVFQGVSEQTTITNVANNIGQMVLEHVNWEALKQAEKKLAKKVERQVSRTAAEGHRRAVTRHVTHEYLPPDLALTWPRADMIKVGLVLLELMQESTGLINMPLVRKGKHHVKVLELTEDAMKWLEDNHTRAALLAPIYEPMIVPPKPWTTTTDGGYYTRKNWLVKNRNVKYQDSLREEDLSMVMDAVNTLQNTAYQVNRAVLEVMEQAMASNAAIGGLPDREKEQLPAKPADIASNDEALKAWKRKAALVYTSRAKQVSRIVSVDRDVYLGRKYAKYDAIYFPHFLDWRGRAYCLPVELQPQGSDTAKALLRFAEGKPLGEDGLFWLYVHIANLFGVDKVSFVERNRWVAEHHEELMRSAIFPLQEDFWLQADKPWQALAAILEYAGASMMDDPREYVSHLPIAMDGSCNGLQNLSALLLDEEGGKATNLVPSDKPQDIYTLVMNRVVENLKELDEAEARRWLDLGLNRKLVKRPVMTKPYGVTAYGMRDQMMGEIRKQELCHEDDVHGLATFLAPFVEQSINETVVASKEVMDWLQATARAAATHNLPLAWYTPVGLKVLQDYRKMSAEKEAVYVGGVKKQFLLSTHTDQVHKQKQANGMSPNVIHSLDASHMMLTLLLGKEYGITSYAMVHDSYATHACNTGLLNAVLREAFIEMYSNDVLGDLYGQFVSQVEPDVAADFPAVPEKGTLDLNQVRDSAYFFA